MKNLCFMLLLLIIISRCSTDSGKQVVNIDVQEIIEYTELNSFDDDADNYIDYYYFTDAWYGYTINNEIFYGGKIIVQMVLLEFIDNNKIRIEIFKEMTGFGQMILERIIAENKEGKYEFEFIDGWDNKAYGNFVFNDDGTITFYLDCKEFSDYGKMIGRLYGDSYILQEGEMKINLNER